MQSNGVAPPRATRKKQRPPATKDRGEVWSLAVGVRLENDRASRKFRAFTRVVAAGQKEPRPERNRGKLEVGHHQRTGAQAVPRFGRDALTLSLRRPGDGRGYGSTTEARPSSASPFSVATASCGIRCGVGVVRAGGGRSVAELHQRDVRVPGRRAKRSRLRPEREGPPRRTAKVS